MRADFGPFGKGCVVDTIWGLVVGALAILVGQIGVALLGPLLVVPINQGHARARFRKEPLIGVGQVLAEIRQGGSDRAVCGKCEIVSITRGRIEVVLLEGEFAGNSMFWTLAEFEAFDPVVVR